MNVLYCALAIATTVSAAASAFMWFAKPSLVLQLIIRIAWFKSGSRIKYVSHKGLKFCYAERGTPRNDQTTLVLLHGFSASKDMWLTSLDKLNKDLHVVIIDLLGHGGSSVPSINYDSSIIFNTIEMLHEVLELSKINKYPLHMVGLSMGGTVAANYAAKYPKEVHLLTLMCPAVLAPNTSKMSEEMKLGRNRLLAETVEEIGEMMDMMFYHKDRKPSNSQLMKGALKIRLQSMPYFKKLYNSLHSSAEQLRKDLDKIEAPTQIIWGNEDQLISVSGAGYIQQRLTNCKRVEVLSECGHAIVWDQLDLAVASILEFRSSIDKKSN